MNIHQTLAVDALNQMKGDDLARATAAFARFSPAQMQQQHGLSSKTRAEIIEGLQFHEQLINAAIAWVSGVTK